MNYNCSIRGQLESVEPNKGKTDSMGLGLATVGQLLKKFKASAEVEYSQERGTITITVKNVRMAEQRMNSKRRVD